MNSDTKIAAFVQQWLRGERKTCDMTFVTSMGGHYRCHFEILKKHSKRYENYSSTASKIIHVDDLYGSSVDIVIGWMYGRRVQVTAENAWRLIRAASHLEVDKLEKYLIQEVKRMNLIIGVLNMASKEMIQEKPPNAFRCHFTFWQPKTFNRAFNSLLSIFYDEEPKLGMSTLRQLNLTSIYALMYDLKADVKTKVRIIFLTIDWITIIRPSLQTIYGILGSLRTDTGFYMTYAIRWHMYMFLTKYNSSSTEFYIWMDGTSEFVLPPIAEIEAIPPANLFYPVDNNLPFTVFIEPRNPLPVNQYRYEFKPSSLVKRERICGLYQPRGEIELKYSYGKKNTRPEWESGRDELARRCGEPPVSPDPVYIDSRLEYLERESKKRNNRASNIVYHR